MQLQFQPNSAYRLHFGSVYVWNFFHSWFLLYSSLQRAGKEQPKHCWLVAQGLTSLLPTLPQYCYIVTLQITATCYIWLTLPRPSHSQYSSRNMFCAPSTSEQTQFDFSIRANQIAVFINGPSILLFCVLRPQRIRSARGATRDGATDLLLAKQMCYNIAESHFAY